jgi:hypothetical protein
MMGSMLVGDHGDFFQCFVARADEGRAFDGVADFAILNQVGFVG